ncbi:MAG: hypothetical protein Ct9H300mP27_02540 [Chloroflexota bacterium]|nr:MAG: hypothetical protein Ct9H300mP27_02540 [Chloroflexota bacterium]
MFSTPVGPGIRELADKWREEGRFLDSHTLTGFSAESAEAFAEVLHQQIRQMWGFGVFPQTSQLRPIQSPIQGHKVFIRISRMPQIGKIKKSYSNCWTSITT